MKTPEETELSIVRKYKKTIWHRFIKAGREYSLINDGDRILVPVYSSAAAILFAKCFERLHKYSETKFEPVFVLQAGDKTARRLFEGFGIKGESAEGDISDMEKLCVQAGKLQCNKAALPDCFDDCTEHILHSILFNGRLEALLPGENAGGIELIRAGMLVRREDIEKFAVYNGISSYTAEETPGEQVSYIRRIIGELKQNNHNLEINILRSCEDVNLETVLSYTEGGKRKSILDRF